ncbi:hypothetical protein ABZ587_45635, partial [Streptomyces sp. NPDC018352]
PRHTKTRTTRRHPPRVPTCRLNWTDEVLGSSTVPCVAVVEIAVDGKADPVPVKLGVSLSNTKSRRDKLTAEQLAALAALGME